MSAAGTTTDVYRLKGEGIELTYRRSDEKLDVSGDEQLLAHDDLDAHAAVTLDTGLCITATLLDSSRNGTRVTLTLLVPEVSEERSQAGAQEVTGVAVVTRSFKDVVGGSPPVLQSYDHVLRLTGTATPAD